MTQSNDNMEQILMQLAGLYISKGEDAVRDILGNTEMSDEKIEETTAQVKQRAQAGVTAPDVEAENRMKVIANDYVQNGEAVVRQRLTESGNPPDIVEQVITQIQQRIQTEQYQAMQALYHILEIDGEEKVRAVLKSQGVDDATMDAIIQTLHNAP